MKAFLQHCSLFILCSILGYVVFICIWGTLTPDYFKPNLNYRIGSYGHMFTRLQEVELTKNVDILFLGSSHVYRGIDPRIFKKQGFEVFNLGSSSQTPIQTELLLTRYLDRLNPKLIIYDVYPESFNTDGVESSVDIIANSANDFESFKMALKINHIKTYNTLIYGFYRDVFHLNSNFEESKIKGDDHYVDHGYIEKKLDFYEGNLTHDIKWNFKSKQVSAFNNIISLITSRHIPYQLVQIPVTSSRYEGYHNKSKFDAFMSKRGNYHNFNNLIQLTDTLHFYDTQHLNSKGVLLFDTYLIETLLKR